MNDPELFQAELCTLRRDYFVALAVLREAIKMRTEQYKRDRAALAQKYGAHIVDATPCPEPDDNAIAELALGVHREDTRKENY